MQDVNEEDFGGDVKEIDTMQGNCKEARIGTQWGLNIFNGCPQSDLSNLWFISSFPTILICPMQ